MLNRSRSWKLLAASAIGLLLLGQTAAAAPLDIQFAITGGSGLGNVIDGSTMTIRFEVLPPPHSRDGPRDAANVGPGV
jgi:hypothetical protein